MKNIYILVLIFLPTFILADTKKILEDIDKIHELRSELTQDISYTLLNGTKITLGRCGFVDLYGINIRSEDIDNWNSNNPDSRDISIPIAFHVIHTSNNTGYLSQSVINEQIEVLNLAFEAWGISFTLSSLDYTENNSWFNNDNEYQYKPALAIDPLHTLNIYTTTAGGYLGYAYFPNDFSESSYMHGVVLNYQSLPGVYNWEYDEGDTAVHEVGHYLGLYHTFENGCSGSGDQVTDTPAQDDGNNIYNCWTMDTCSSTGNDPIHNYMNYTDDPCLTEFTNGQSNRIDYMLETYKPNLGVTVVAGCMDIDSCNYNPDATVNNGSCVYPEEFYDCYGDCLVGIDCSGSCGGNLEIDCCGVCGGNNSSCSNCCGIPFNDDCSSDCYIDNCGICDDDSTNDCAQDCDGIWGGSNLGDECDICDGDGTSCLGDVNNDELLNILDVVLLVDIILNQEATYSYPADINQDGLINVNDIVMIVYILLNA